jgi:hypothetical protein
MTEEWWFGKDLEGNVPSTNDVLNRHLPGREIMIILSSDSQCPAWDSKQKPPEWRSTAILVLQPARWLGICLDGFRETPETKIGIGRVQPQTRTEQVRNRILHPYHYTNLLDASLSSSRYHEILFTSYWAATWGDADWQTSQS